MDTIFYGVIAFTAVILALVVILMMAKARLVASGDVLRRGRSHRSHS